MLQLLIEKAPTIVKFGTHFFPDKLFRYSSKFKVSLN